MGNWSWKNAVMDKVVEIVETKHSAHFDTDDMYSFQRHFASLFPNNNNIQAKIRQTLQYLRDDGLIIFVRDGRYALNIGSQDLEVQGEVAIPSGAEIPDRRARITNVIIRNPACAREMKVKYNCVCQVCRMPVHMKSTPHYAEAHHLIPLGGEHKGSDMPGNIIVVCPNHHKMFDYGALYIEPQSLVVRHLNSDYRPEKQKLHKAQWHKLYEKSLVYHKEIIARV